VNGGVEKGEEVSCDEERNTKEASFLKISVLHFQPSSSI
jgi:hypothetical protein